MPKCDFNKIALHQCRSHFLINFIKKRFQHMYFPVKFVKFLTTLILKNICERLLLTLVLGRWEIIIESLGCLEHRVYI